MSHSPRDVEKNIESAADIELQQIALSSSVILFNKYLFDTLDFPYPIFLTTFHMAVAAGGTRLLKQFTPLMGGLDDVKITRDMYIRSIVPIGALFSGSLILSNMAYLSLSVSFIQMLKAFTPVAILLISFAFRLQEPNQKLVAIIAMISIGCALAAYGELLFEPFGFTCQVLAVAFDRLVMIQVLLHGLKMDPLVSLYYYSPVCAIINACILPFTEGLEPFYAIFRVGPFILAANASVAFSLNVAAVFLIGASSGLVLTLAGVFKDILLISSSTLLFNSSITPLQIFGYSIALGGLVLFKTAGGK
ncbi:TPT-domain-containing protein [Mrakia frigida]|uniref:TPT-domain-containing protein n=1 Tax=Mrakia frigida TaxID=29902 RepID=UPI003FCC0466